MRKTTMLAPVILAMWAAVAIVVFAEEPPGRTDIDERLEELREDMAATDSNDRGVLMPDMDEDDAQADSFPNPYGCYGQTDNPHASRTAEYLEVVVKARTVCPNGPSMTRIGVDIVLMKGSICISDTCLIWTPYGTPSYNELENRTRVDGIAVGSPCENGDYKGESLHYIVDSEGNFYWRYTEKKNEVSNCAL